MFVKPADDPEEALEGDEHWVLVLPDGAVFHAVDRQRFEESGELRPACRYSYPWGSDDEYVLVKRRDVEGADHTDRRPCRRCYGCPRVVADDLIEIGEGR